VKFPGIVMVVPPPQRETAGGENETGSVRPVDGAFPVIAMVACVDWPPATVVGLKVSEAGAPGTMFTDAVRVLVRNDAVTVAVVAASTGSARPLHVPVVDPAATKTDVSSSTSRFVFEASVSATPGFGAGPLSA
jgi:hypothetical protein